MMSYQPIPKISPATYDLAHQCCLLLWHGVEFSTGRNQTSDAALLQTWSSKFQGHITANKQLRYSAAEINALTSAAKVGRFLNFKAADVKNLNRSFNQSIVSLYGQPGITSDIYSQELGKALARNPTQPGKIVIASRFLFFALPDRCTFNLYEGVAVKLGMHRMATKFKSDLVSALHDRMHLDWKILRALQMPQRTSEIKYDTWKLACDGGWWQRRVLDIAVLIHLKLASAAYTKNLLRTKQNPKKC